MCKHKYVSKNERINNYISTLTSFVECKSTNKLSSYLETLTSKQLDKEIDNIDIQLLEIIGNMNTDVWR